MEDLHHQSTNAPRVDTAIGRSRIGAIRIAYVVYLGIMYTFVGMLGLLVYESVVQAMFPKNYKQIIDLNQRLEDDPNFHVEVKAIMKLVGFTIIDVIGIAIAGFTLRKIVKAIPFPLQGVGGFDRYSVKEIDGGVILTSIVLAVFTFRTKLKIYQKIWFQNPVPIIVMCTLVVFMTLSINIPNLIRKA